MDVLLFQAIGLPDGSIAVPPPFTGEGVPSAPGDSPSDLEVELLDAGGALLVRHRVGFASPCAVPLAGGPDEAPPRLAQAMIVQHAKARTLRVSQWGRTLHERTVAAPPAIDVAWPTAAGLAAAEVKLSWACADSAVLGLWQYSNDGRTWAPISLPQPAGTIGVDLRGLPGGKTCRLRLLVADGVQTHRFESKPMALKPRGWVGLLLAPADGARVARGREVELVGQGFEIEKRLAEFEQLSWTSSIDGDLGSGHRRRVRLSPGKHRITLLVQGQATRAVSVVVD